MGVESEPSGVPVGLAGVGWPPGTGVPTGVAPPPGVALPPAVAPPRAGTTARTRRSPPTPGATPGADRSASGAVGARSRVKTVAAVPFDRTTTSPWTPVQNVGMERSERRWSVSGWGWP